ncbi:MAG: HD domain-containing protein [Candidatus Pacebacteria bacterium]|nr:HD domain-containing protein [Candidatus Paceibacterota bacterium]
MTSALIDALNFAAVAHDGQKRKDGVIPYIIHPFGVGLILLEHGYSEEVVIAGFLHDVIEDSDFTFADIEEKFGTRVAKIVAMVTHDRTIATHEIRFKGYLDNLEKADEAGRAVCLADMLHNRKSLIQELKRGYDIWGALKISKEKYLDESYQRLVIIKKTINNKLVEEVEKELEIIETQY